MTKLPTSHRYSGGLQAPIFTAKAARKIQRSPRRRSRWKDSDGASARTRHSAGWVEASLRCSGLLLSSLICHGSPPAAHHAAARLGPETKFQNRAKTVLGAFGENVLLAPRLAAVAGQQHERILRQRKKLLPGGPPGFGVHKLEMIETSAANPRMDLSPRPAGIIAAQQDRVKSHCGGMNVTRCKKLIARRRRSRQLQENWAGGILQAAHARPLHVIRCARERQHHGFARVLENYRRRSHRWVASRDGRLVLSPGARPGHRENEGGKPQLHGSQIVACGDMALKG